jgi:hypothetical protein
MTEHYLAPDEDSGEVYGNAGASPSEAWHAGPPADPMPPAFAVGEDPAAPAAVVIPVSADTPYVPVTQNQPPHQLYAHKNEVLYAFGGLFFPGLVLLLMGQKKQGIIMLCCWLASIALSVVLIGIPLLVGVYIWSVISCFREARRQNEAHGFVS